MKDTFTLLRQLLNKMRTVLPSFCFGAWVALMPMAWAQQEVDPRVRDAAIVELREAISKLVDVQTLESKERHDWEVQQRTLGELLELHRRELALLEEELAEAGATAPAHEEQTAELKAGIKELKEARSLAAEAVVRNLPRLIRLAAQFPQPLQLETQGELADLAAFQPVDEPRDALLSMLSVIDKAEQFNRRFTRSTEVHEGSEVQVLYLGLAQAYYLDRGDKAGIGRPGPEGWRWKSDPDIRNALQAAFDILDKKRAPAVVTLPLTLD